MYVKGLMTSPLWGVATRLPSCGVCQQLLGFHFLAAGFSSCIVGRGDLVTAHDWAYNPTRSLSKWPYVGTPGISRLKAQLQAVLKVPRATCAWTGVDLRASLSSFTRRSLPGSSRQHLAKSVAVNIITWARDSIRGFYYGPTKSMYI